MKKKVLFALIVIIPCLLTTGVGYLYQLGQGELIRNTVSMAVCITALLLFWIKEENTDSMDYNNGRHFGRFLLIYLCDFGFSLALPVIPFPVWPIMPFALALSLYGNAFLGLFAYSTILMNAVLLSGATSNVFFLYFTSGAVAICVFHKIEEDFKYGIPLATTLLYFFVTETAFSVLFINERLGLQMFIYPILNVFLSALFIIGILKSFSANIIHRFLNKYQEMMDPEFDLLVDMKEKHNRDYLIAIHTAFLSERIASAIHADVYIAKACAYYHRLGKIYKDKYPSIKKETEVVNKVCDLYEFPDKIVSRIQECVARHYGSKEATLVLFSDAIITSIYYMFDKDPNKKPDYDQIINLVFTKKGDPETLKETEITIHDLKVMKEIFMKEKIYYDLLYRR